MFSLSLTELLWTQTWSGAPLYVLAILAQGLWLHQSGRISLPAVACSAVFSAGLSILAGVIIWGRFFGGQDIMLWQLLNIPAIFACFLVFPLVGLLVRIGFSD